MAKRKTSIPASDAFLGGASDIPFVEKPPEKDLAAEIFAGNMDVQKKMDEFEASMGIVRAKPKIAPPVYKSIMLDLDKATDRKLFDNLLNDTKYRILERNNSWTALGRLRCFIVYSEVQVVDNKTPNSK